MLLTDLTTEIVEQVILRDESLATNTELSSMLTYYGEQIESGYEPDETTTTAILGVLETVVTSDPALQTILDTVSEVLAPVSLPATFGVTFTGIDGYDYSGFSVSSAGDVNGDGIDDILIGAMGAEPEGTTDYSVGETYVVFGRPTTDPFAATLDLASLNGSNGFRLTGIDAGDYSGLSVSSAGDVNGDGIDDILIGAAGATPDGTTDEYAGETYLIYGGDDIFDRFDFADGTSDGVIDLANLGLNPADYNPLV